MGDSGVITSSGSRPIHVFIGEPIDAAPRNFITCPPVVGVYLAADDTWTTESTKTPLHNGVIYYALLDTGSDRIALRSHVATAIGAKLRGNGLVHGTAGTHADVMKTTIQIVSITASFIFLCEDAAVTNLPGDARSFDAILGRQFLRHCRLVVDGPNEAYRFEFCG
jgi:hypothetical protein